MKYLKLFEEMDIDSKTDNRMRDANKRMEEGAKKLQAGLQKLGIKFISKNTNSSDDSRKLRQEAIKKIQGGDENAYGIMQWTSDNDICQSIQIIVPAKGIEFLRIPIIASNLKISYNEVPGQWGALEVYNSPGEKEASSLYMQYDGEVIFQWNDYENTSKGSFKGQAKGF
jgi:hypothetical protein